MTTPGKVRLQLAHWDRDGDDIREGLSAARLIGDDLWLACDETACLERLSRQVDGGFGGHAVFPLAQLLDLPGRASGEADIEGLAFDDGYLWVVGSHSLKRKKPKPGMTAEEALVRLAKLKRDPNRFLMARLPLIEHGGRLQPSRSGAALLAGGANGNLLTKALAKDPHLKPFLKLPAKENGFDIEGLAADGGRLFLGLRGPVLRALAVVLEVRPFEAGAGRLELAPFENGMSYRKHFLDLGGLGVRDLCMQGADILVLAGPAMDGPGPFALHRWRPAGDGGGVVAAERLPAVLHLPHPEQKPEGVTLLDQQTLLAVYDSPDPDRKAGDGVVIADVLRL